MILAHDQNCTKMSATQQHSHELGWLSGHFLSTSLGWRSTEVRTNWMTPLRQHACKWLSATLNVRVGKRLQMEPDRHSREPGGQKAGRQREALPPVCLTFRDGLLGIQLAEYSSHTRSERPFSLRMRWWWSTLAFAAPPAVPSSLLDMRAVMAPQRDFRHADGVGLSKSNLLSLCSVGEFFLP